MSLWKSIFGAEKPMKLELSDEPSRKTAIAAPKMAASKDDLFKAAVRGDAAAVRALLDEGVQVNARGLRGFTALSMASLSGHLDVVRALLEKGADVNSKADDGVTALMLAKDDRIRALLVQAESPPREAAPTQPKVTVAAPVCHIQGADMTKLLIEGARTGSIDKVSRALESGVDANVEIEEPVVIEKGAFSQFELGDLMEALAPKTRKTNALEEALTHGHTEIVRLLLRKGANITDRKTWDDSLLTAAQQGNSEICAIALEHGANVNCFRLHKMTPLIWASGKGHESTVRFLIGKGADLNHWCTDPRNPGRPFRTAQMWASDEGRHGIVKILTEAGTQLAQPTLTEWKTSAEVRAKAAKAANPSLDAEKVQALFKNADINGNEGALRQMLDLGADPNAKEDIGITALHNAASHGRKAIAELLLSYGADVNAKDMLGHTPLHNAESKGHNDLAELLRRHGGK